MARWTVVSKPGWPSRLHAVVGTTVLASLVVVALALWQAQGVVLAPWQLGLLLVGVPASELALLHVRVNGDYYSFTWGEACLLVGFSLVSPAWTTLVAGPLVVAVHLACRRGLMKSLFNGASFTLAAGAAALVVTQTAAAPYDVLSMRTTLALVAGATIYSLISALLTGLVVSVATGRSPSSVLRTSARMAVVVWAGNVTLAFGVLQVAQHSRTALWAIPPVIVAVLVGYRAYLSASQERDAWQQLEAAARELNRLEETDLAAAAIARAGQMFRTGDVVLALSASNGQGARAYALDGQGALVCRPDYGDPAGVELDLSRRMPSAPCILAPLSGPTGRLGSLRLSFDSPVRLSGRERQLLSTYAHAVGTTLLNAYLYADARAEASRQAHEATHDPLTGLANRSLLNSAITAAMDSEAGVTALLLLDLDHFKQINDTLGHAAGDLVLEEVARRLRRAVRPGDLVARLGGDEFAVLLTGLADAALAAPVADQLLVALAEPVDYEGLHLSVDASIGLACHPMDAGTADELFRRCDVAMYQAKQDRGAWLRYDPLRDDSSVQRLTLVAELRAALEDQLVVHFQPQVDLSTGAVIGAEALVRWQHPERGLLQPGEFVGVAEQSGLVGPFTLQVLDMAVAECARWQRPNRSMSVAVNVGARALMDAALPDHVAAVLARYALPPHCLVLEITETTAASQLEVVEEVLGRLRRLGVEISVDDFGTGYSSLAFLQRTAVHELKVDRSFVSGMLVNDNDLALVRATIHLAHSLGARAVAEGVESQALQVALGSLGCDVAQGYHLGRPMPSGQLRTLIAANRGALPLPRTEGERHLSSVSPFVDCSA